MIYYQCYSMKVLNPEIGLPRLRSSTVRTVVDYHCKPLHPLLLYSGHRWLLRSYHLSAACVSVINEALHYRRRVLSSQELLTMSKSTDCSHNCS